jgi:hypothetical protein
MTKDWELLFPLVHVYKIPRALSDHNPLVLATKSTPREFSIEFRFELSWLKDHEFKSKSQELWDEPTRDVVPLDRVMFKLKKVRKFLKGWGF